MHFYTPTGEPLDQPREWEPAVLDLEIDAPEWGSASLRINGAEVPVYAARRFGAERVLADWPRSGPGGYRLVLEWAGGQAEHVARVGSAKLGEAGLVALIGDLERRLPASIAIGLQRTGGLVGLKVRPPNENTIEEEMLRLRRAVIGWEAGPGLATLLPAVAADPHQMLSREDLWVPREAARRVPVSGLIQTLTKPGNVDATMRPVRALDSRVHRTVDVYENRLLKAFAQEVRARLMRLERVAGSQATVTAEATALRATLDLAIRAARDLVNEVGPLTVAPDRLTMVLLREPRYRAVLDRFREFHRSLWVELDEEGLDAPLENLPSLYQSWGTLGVIDALLEVAADLGYRLVQQRLVRRRPGTLFVEILRDGEPVLRLEHPATGVVVTCTPERTFGGGGELRSISFSQRPDLVLEVRRPDGTVELLLFDPKYKLDGDEEGSGRPVKSDVDKMHSYRDSIRNAQGRHVVRYAATLYPGETVEYGAGVAAIGAAPGDSARSGHFARESLRRWIA